MDVLDIGYFLPSLQMILDMIDAVDICECFCSNWCIVVYLFFRGFPYFSKECICLGGALSL